MRACTLVMKLNQYVVNSTFPGERIYPKHKQNMASFQLCLSWKIGIFSHPILKMVTFFKAIKQIRIANNNLTGKRAANAGTKFSP